VYAFTIKIKYNINKLYIYGRIMFHINNIKLNLYIKNKTRIVKPLFFIIYKGRNEKKKKKGKIFN